MDEYGRQIQKVLELIRPVTAEEPYYQYDGYCGAASEAYLHLAGGRDSGLKVMRMENPDKTTHWWLEGPRGVIDLTLGPRDRRDIESGQLDSPAYEHGKGAMFRSGYARPSQRAQAIIDLVTARRR
jgi:hypothetical protein